VSLECCGAEGTQGELESKVQVVIPERRICLRDERDDEEQSRR